ncbi:Hypothetical predicted protein [Lecanosticta acicola]|uniref:Uncharacterized protein n=1 Tax=Lecanosticta acicola TaxID=111012 RepID=A0AAI9E7U9_9PEZI|nr:Hypothetical predicted protein [Lecanosticta acicola]
MASSSNRNTCQEQDLRYYYKLAYGRLFFSNLYQEAQNVNLAFVHFLDTTHLELLTAFRRDQDYDAFRALVSRQRNRPSENTNLAVEALSDAAAVLERNGRHWEAVRMGEFVQQMVSHAQDLANDGS